MRLSLLVGGFASGFGLSFFSFLGFRFIGEDVFRE